MGEPLLLREYDDARAFGAAVEPFLVAREAEHNLVLGLIATTIAQPDRWDPPLAFVAVERDGETVAAAIRTPPWVPSISLVDDPAAIAMLVARFAATPGVDGVSGPAGPARAFAEEWERQTGQTARQTMSQRIYRLDRVTPPAAVPGALRRASADDRPLLLAWMEAFYDESFPATNVAPRQAERSIDARLADTVGGMFLWIDDAGEPVSMAGATGPTPHAIRIGPVYTPPGHRRRGYASAATAALSQGFLDNGRRFVTLFTDLANPTSNRIYQAIGYQPVIDTAVYHFEQEQP